MTAPKSRVNPSHLRDCITVLDARLIAGEIRRCANELVRGLNTDQNCRVLRVTADAIDAWATKVAMRRGDPVPPVEDGPDPPRDRAKDPAWQSTDFDRKYREAKGMP